MSDAVSDNTPIKLSISSTELLAHLAELGPALLNAPDINSAAEVLLDHLQVVLQPALAPVQLRLLLWQGNQETQLSRGEAWSANTPITELSTEVQGQDLLCQLSVVMHVEMAALFQGDGSTLILMNFLSSAATQLSSTLERLAGAAQLAQQMSERTYLLSQMAALDAFARFTELSTHNNQVTALAAQATEVLRTTLGHVTVAYYELDAAGKMEIQRPPTDTVTNQPMPLQGRWKGKAWSNNLPLEIVSAVQLGVPLHTVNFKQAVALGGPLFVEEWSAQQEGLNTDDIRGALALCPYFLDGQPYSMLSAATLSTSTWTHHERTVFRAVARSLGLALERAAVLETVESQRSELAARTKALESFATLTRDLTLQAEELDLVRRAQEVAMSMLPAGCALYYRPEGSVWRMKSQVGSLNNPALQHAVDVGLPFEATQNLLIPWQTGKPYYQSQYNPTTDNLGDLIELVGSTATLPVFVAGKTVGILAVVLVESQAWSAADRSTLEAVVGSLGLAKEGAQSVLALRARSAELERSNSELEQFAYVASHDLQEPLRTVTSFAQLLVGKYRGQLDPKADVYLGMITDGTGRMSRLLQDLLAFSRVTTTAQPLKVVATAQVLSDVLSDLADQRERTGAIFQLPPVLPEVLGDASQLRQLFQNIIGNALKFSRPKHAPVVTLTAESDGPLWRFAISDNGIGIDPAFFDRIFVIFQRLHSREAFEGNGIGLAIARKIVERHGGSIWIDPPAQQGSTFLFTLLDAKQPTPIEAVYSTGSSFPAHGMF